MTIPVGTLRRLQQAATAQGTFTVLAIDHRGPVRRQLVQLPGVNNLEEALATLKQDIVRALAPSSSAVLLDPEIGLEPCVRAAALPGQTGLLIALDTGSTGDPAVLHTGLVAGWSVGRIARSGAAGVKLLVYYHHETAQAAHVESLVRAIASSCEKEEIPLYLEPLCFDPRQPRASLSSGERRRLVIETARRLVPLGVTVLKAEFPVDPVADPDENLWREACHELTEACEVPWVLLSGGATVELFLRQVAVACECGASGVMAGRVFWNEAITLEGQERRRFLNEEARRRLEEVRSVCDSRARPFHAVRLGRFAKDSGLH
jgi:tagatose-1,6-bisphosphate aldolase